MSSNKGLKGTYASKDGRDTGKHGGEKNRGLFSPDDWTCKNCHNINWARRTTCNACNTPRVNNLGERTGYGGGFMERDEVVEYRHRDRSDSEDEFDEFGRKKKRFRQSAQPTSADPRPPHQSRSPNRSQMKKSQKLSVPVTSNNDDRARDNNDDDDEEEEEESGDDADLSKYDIWSGDEADGSGVTSKTGAQAKPTDDASGSATSDSDTGSSSSGSSDSSRAQKRGSSESSSDSSSSEEPAHNGRLRRPSRDTGRDRSRFENRLCPARLWPSLCRIIVFPLTSPLTTPTIKRVDDELLAASRHPGEISQLRKQLGSLASTYRTEPLRRLYSNNHRGC